MSRAAILAYKSKRFFLEKVGTLGFWGGALLLLVDMTTPFPTPARGAYAMWWLLVIGGAAVIWIKSRRLPVEEALHVAEEYLGELTIPILSKELGLSLDMAAKTLDLLCRYDEAKEINAGHTKTWFFHNINPDKNRLVVHLDQLKPEDDDS